MSIVIGLCHDSREIIETFSESVESSYHMIARNWWSCDRQDSVRSLNEVTVMAMKISGSSQPTLKRYPNLSNYDIILN